MARKVRFVINVADKLQQLVWVQERGDKSLVIGIPDNEYVRTPGEQRFSVHNTPGQAYQTIMQSLKRSNGVRRSPQKVMLDGPNRYALVTTKRCAPLDDEGMVPNIRPADLPIALGSCHSQQYAIAFSVVISQAGQPIEDDIAFNSYYADLVLYRVTVVVNYFMAQAVNPSESIEFVTSSPTIGDDRIEELSGPTACSASDIVNIHFNNLCLLGIGLYRISAEKLETDDSKELFDRCSTVISRPHMLYEDAVVLKLPVTREEPSSHG